MTDLRTQLYVVRHAESVANSEQRFTRHDHEPLTPLGVEQAREAGRRLAGIGFGAAYSSPYYRARQTALEILEQQKQLELELEESIREQSFGSFAGSLWSRYYPLVTSVSMAERWAHRPPGGESLQDVRGRIAPAFDRIASRHPSQSVLVVCHGAVMVALRAHVSGDPHPMPESTPNADGFQLTYERDRGYRGPFGLFVSESQSKA